MRIISESSERISKIKRNKELVPTIVDKIFSICKEDSNFSINSDITNIDNKIQNLENQLSKQKELLEKATQMENTLKQKIKLLIYRIFFNHR